MGFFDKFRRSKPDAGLKQLFEVQEALHAALSDGGGIDADELPNGVGKFGWSLENPIPCKTMLGSMAYLAKLRTQDGGSVLAERVGSFGSEVISSPVDGYRLMLPDGTDLGMIYISPYQARNSKMAPEGLKLL